MGKTGPNPPLLYYYHDFYYYYQHYHLFSLYFHYFYRYSTFSTDSYCFFFNISLTIRSYGNLCTLYTQKPGEGVECIQVIEKLTEFNILMNEHSIQQPNSYRSGLFASDR